MFRRLAALFLLMASGGSAASASCGSSCCALDSASHEAPRAGRLRLDASFQYIDQRSPRIGARRAAVGELRNPDHDEVETTNRVWNLKADYDVTSGWGLGLVVPVVSRSHDHFDVADGANAHWGFTGLGDVVAQGRFVAGPWTLTGGVKLPTGRTTARNAAERAETVIQPGTGSYDLIAGLGYARPLGPVPAFASVSYKQDNPGSDGYRLGDEVVSNLGASYPVLSRLDLLAQANLRVRMRDYNGKTAEDTSFTGGNTLFLSPGLRLKLGGGVSSYVYLQLPVYQRVNQEQLTAERNWLFGVSWEL